MRIDDCNQHQPQPQQQQPEQQKQEEKVIRVSYQDMYLITFNRTNGSTPEQQMRIYNRTKAFEEQLEKLIEEIRYDKEMIIQKNKKKKKNDDKEWEISENG